MANDQNLRPIKLSHDEAMRIGQKGGIASGESRRQRRRMREYAELVLDLSVSNKSKYNKLIRMGIKPQDIDNEMLLIVGLIEKAQGGDVSAAREIRAIIGEDVALPPGSNDEYDGLFDAIAKAVLNREI